MVKRPTMIFVVDDDPSVRKALKRLLSSAGFSVESFASAGELLVSEAGTRPDLLILDVRMPGRGGLELQRELAATGSRTPVIFITAYRDDRAHALAREGGAIAYLEKPIDDEVLLEAVERALERGRSGLANPEYLQEG